MEALQAAMDEIRDAVHQLTINAAPPRHDRPERRRSPTPDQHRSPSPQRRRRAAPAPPRRWRERTPSNEEERYQINDREEPNHRPRRQQHRSPPRERRAHSPGIRRERIEEMDEEMDRYRARYRRLEGRKAIMHDMFVKDPIAKPHMYLSRPGCNSLAQKLAARHTMTEREYMAAFMALLHDEEVYDPRDYRDMIDHLRCVTEDCMRKPWPTVREWSQKLFDKVEKRQLRWADKQGIQNDRFTAHTPLITEERGQHVQTAEPRTARGRIEAEPHERPCTTYNSNKKCTMPQHHQDGPQEVVHACAYCYRITQVYYDHSEQQCRRKTKGNLSKN